MAKGIPKDIHGVGDYLYAPAAFLAPDYGDFTEDKFATGLCRAAGALVLTYTLLTDAKWGVAKVLPYKKHLMVDIALGVATLGALAIDKRSTKRSRNALLAMGLTSLVVGSLSLLWLGGGSGDDEE